MFIWTFQQVEDVSMISSQCKSGGMFKREFYNSNEVELIFIFFSSKEYHSSEEIQFK